ncbi:MAG: (deoxy)nucleoside triphosphate pyrophosphohydrolase [Desulfonatronovibrio sp.]|nr:(deoxy)nucleoside triphosphate pyrophosphohydrolase [Desulfovibrionales bacterium]
MEWIKVAAGIVVKEGLVLIVKRPPGKTLAGFYEFPGGKAESGESVENALKRELQEEIGIKPLDFWLWTSIKKSYDHINAHVHFFIVKDFEGQIHSREKQELIWTHPAGFDDKNFLPADREILKKVVHIL